MYEEFGAKQVDGTASAEFKLFVPDNTLAPFQFSAGGLPRLRGVFVVGNFQQQMGEINWTASDATRMRKGLYENKSGQALGWVYSWLSPDLPEGFYEYKYYLEFENADPRYVGDPCSRYGSRSNQNAAFVIGGRKIANVAAHPSRLPYKDLIVYELMIDDFTKEFLDGRAPLDAIKDKLDYLIDLGINAIEFMPWTAWPSHDFSWGYNPFEYFSVAHRYTLDPENSANKIFYLKELISLCHQKKIQVIMDGVFNHADAYPPDRGFAYYWIYQDPADSPYVGDFADHKYYQDLDYENQCTLEFIVDACKYWIDTFQIDGIRFDNTTGLYKADDRAHGLPRLLAELRAHLSEIESPNFALILEHSWDYSAIDVTNKVGATSCWFDKFRSLCMGYLGERRLDAKIMRVLDSGKDFGLGRVPTIYVENHDHERFILKAGGRGEWWRTQPFMIALFTSPGAVLIYNGQEFGEDRWMPEEDREAEEKRVKERPLRWEFLNDEAGERLRSFYKQLIGVRKAHPGLRSSNFYPADWDETRETLDQDGFGVDVNRKVVVYHRWGEADDGALERFYIVLNFSDSSQRVKLRFPEADGWEDLTSGWRPALEGLQLTFDVGSNWGHVFYKKS
jgi:pullulanase